MQDMQDIARDDTFDFGGPADEGDLLGDMDPYDADDYYGRGPCKCPIYDCEANIDPGRGCRKCNPPMFDCKPGIEGIDKYKDPAFSAAGQWTFNVWIGGPYRQYEARAVRMAMREKKWSETTTLNPRIERASRRKWDRLCDECETHDDAIEAYEAWAARALKVLANKPLTTKGPRPCLA